MRYLVEFAALMVIMPLTLRHLSTNRNMLRADPPRLFQKWSSQSRAIFVWISMAFTVLVAIPAGLLSIFTMLATDVCTQIIGNSSFCIGSGRYVVAVLLIGVLGPLFWKWLFLLARIRNFQRTNF